MAASRSQDTNVDDGGSNIRDAFLQDHLNFRLSRASERYAPENLQWRASLVWEEDRDALLEIPTLPIDQITEGRIIIAERLGETLGFAVVLPRDDGEAELNGFFVKLKLWRKGIGHR
jgi:Acetyltransferase (GNAT) family